MFHLRFERHIEQPIEDVFARLIDIDAYPDWLPQSLIFKGGGLEDPEQAIEVGTRFVDRTPFGRFHGEVTELDPPRRVAFEQSVRQFGRLAFISKPSYTLEPTDNGTQVIHDAVGETHGPTRLFEPLVRVLASKERQRTIDELKRSLET
ncbi:MAG: SRPBCC family protein [Actinomycetota bacterium]